MVFLFAPIVYYGIHLANLDFVVSGLNHYTVERLYSKRVKENVHLV